MAIFPWVLALAGSPVEYSGRLETIGVQPVELANFRSGLNPGVVRQIKPVIGMALASLVLTGVTPLRRQAAG